MAPSGSEKTERVLLDDLVVYGAEAIALGEDAEWVDVYAPAVPSHVRGELGLPVSVRLEYPAPEPPLRGHYVFESITESLVGDSGVCMRFTLLDGDFEDAEFEDAAEY